MIPDQIGGKASNEDRPHVGFFRRFIFISNNMADYTWHSSNDYKALWDILSGQRFSHSTPSHPSLVKITPFVSCAELALAIFFFSRANSLEKYTNQFSIAVNRKAIYFLEFSCISGGKCLDQGGNGLVGD